MDSLNRFINSAYPLTYYVLQMSPADKGTTRYLARPAVMPLLMRTKSQCLVHDGAVLLPQNARGQTGAMVQERAEASGDRASYITLRAIALRVDWAEVVSRKEAEEPNLGRVELRENGIAK